MAQLLAPMQQQIAATTTAFSRNGVVKDLNSQVDDVADLTVLVREVASGAVAVGTAPGVGE